MSFSNLMRSVVKNPICGPNHFHSTADENSCAKYAQQFVIILSHLMLPFAIWQCFKKKIGAVPVFLILLPCTLKFSYIVYFTSLTRVKSHHFSYPTSVPKVITVLQVSFAEDCLTGLSVFIVAAYEE